MRRVRIGICTALETARWTVWEREAFLLSRAYIDAVQQAGALCLMIPPDPRNATDPDSVLAGLDGLILAGGADVDPSSYGAERHRCTTGTKPERDAAEIPLARRALELDLPLLGICRGMQLMNVARGGTLIQHLPDDVGHRDHRRHLGSFDGADHDVRLAAGSLAARACGELCHATKSHHHQAVDRLGEGFVATRLERARRPDRGDGGARRPLGARRAVASGGRRPLGGDRGAGRGGRAKRCAGPGRAASRG